MTTVLVIGASRGIGLEFVRQSLQAGERVIATARDDAGRERLAALGAQVLTVDVANPASVSGLALQLDGEKIDTALYVAGVMSRADAPEPPSPPEFDRVMHTNVLGAMQVMAQVAPLVAASDLPGGGLHPGWVQTDMGGASAPVTVTESAAGLRATLAALTPSDRGRFLNYDGTPYASW